MTFRLESPAFADGARIPPRHSCEGEDVSPALRWSGAPTGTRSFVLLCDDPDAPGGIWRHWALFDLPAAITGVEEDRPKRARIDEGRQGENDFRRPGYGGPCPPPGHGVHHYRFRLLALDIERLDPGSDADCVKVEEAARPHILDEALLIGLYSR